MRTLSALELTSADSRPVGSVLAQPRRAALLCYLALALPRGFHRRDTLFALFWPEYDADQARHALRQSVYFLRRALGPKSIVSRGDEELALAPDQVCCDVWAFDAAVDDEASTHFQRAEERNPLSRILNASWPRPIPAPAATTKRSLSWRNCGPALATARTGSEQPSERNTWRNRCTPRR